MVKTIYKTKKIHYGATLLVLPLLVLLLIACGSNNAATPTPQEPTTSPTDTSMPAPTTPPTNPTTPPTPPTTPTSPPTTPTTPPTNPTTPTTPPNSQTLTLETAEARFVVNEVFAAGLVNVQAIGTTRDVIGSISFDTDGNINTNDSFWEVNVSSLTTDDQRRDDFLSRDALQTGTFSEATFQIESIENLPWPLPTSGSIEVTINGQMTVRDVVKSQSWSATAEFSQDTVVVTASTNLKFGDYGMEVPSLFFIASIEDNILLELQATLSLT